MRCPPLSMRQRVDFAGQAARLVGDDPLHRLEPVLDRADLGAQLGVLAGQQLDPLLRFLVGLRDGSAWPQLFSSG